jgi:hypothetical protein
LFTGNETLSTNGYFAYTTAETFFVPLPCLVFHLLRSGSEDFVATVTSGGELFVITTPAVDPVALRSKLPVHEGFPARCAQEARFVPMLVFVREVFWIDTNSSAALFASIGEDGFVTGHAIGVLVAKNVTLTSKTLIALPTTEVLSMPVLVHGLCIFAAKNELITAFAPGLQ